MQIMEMSVSKCKLILGDKCWGAYFMKAFTKKLGAVIMSAAMMAGLTQMTGAAAFADETETGASSSSVEETTSETTAETTKETETSSEAPKETEGTKETKAPEETKITETEKAPEATVSRKKKNGPAQIIEKVDAYLDKDTGILTINKYGDEITIDIQIAGVVVDQYYYDDEEGPATYKYNVKEAIDKLIKRGDIVRQDAYSVWLFAYDAEVLIATWNDKITYDSKVPTSINGLSASINNGILKWKNMKGTTDIFVLISDFRCVFFSDKTSLQLDKEIDWLIQSGYIENTGTFDIRILFYNENTNSNIAIWSQKYEYKTTATAGQKDALTGFSCSNGVLTWDEYKDADEYRYIYTTPYGCVEFWAFDENKLDVNDYISQLVRDKSLNAQNHYSITIQAIKFGYTDAFDDPLILAEGTYEYDFAVAPNPLNVSGKTATVKNKKLKKKKQVLSASKVINGLGTARGKLTYTKVSGNKNIKINASTGAVTIKKKGLKKKTYTVKVKVKAAGNMGYDPSDVKVVTFKIKVK